MKVLHLNTSLTESSAPYKLHKAMLEAGIESKVMTLNPSGLNDDTIITAHKSISYRLRRKIMAYRRSRLMSQYSPIEYMPISLLPYGLDVSKHPLVQSADIIILHWISGDFMSPKTIEKLLQTGKKVYWFCHDNSPFTGGCHVRLGCEGYKNGCEHCPQLQTDRLNKLEDIARENTELCVTAATKYLLQEKRRLLQYPNLILLSPSTWMDGNVSGSIFKNNKHFVLPNVIDTDIFVPKEKHMARKAFAIPEDSFVILAGLKSNDKIPYNGTEYLWEILQKFYDEYEEKNRLQIVVFGVKDVHNAPSYLPIMNVGFIKGEERLSMLYSAADVYLVTSLEDSFNQTVAECMACNTPVVAFNNGGIADIINNSDCLIELRDSNQFVNAIKLHIYDEINSNIRDRIISEYMNKVVVDKFMKIIK